MLTPTAVLYPQGCGADDFFADTDWATGIVRMHVAYDAFKSLLSGDYSALGEDDQTAVAAISHESMHVLQMINTGFAYEHSKQCFQHVAKALQDHRADLDQIYRHLHAYQTDLELVMNTLLRSSSDGVCALDLLEGSAYLIEKRIHSPELGPRGFEAMFAEDVDDDVYSYAYYVATDALGDDAFDQFVHIATLALQTSEPHTVFRPLVEQFRDFGSRSDLLHNHRIGLKLLNEQFGDVLLGHPLERIDKGSVHPILAPLVEQMNAVDMDPLVGPVQLMAQPYALGDPMAQLLVGLTIFPPRTPGQSAVVYLPAAWEKGRTGHKVLRPEDMLVLSAASSLLCANIHPVPDRPPTMRTPRLDARYKPITWRRLSFSPQHRTVVEQDGFAAFTARVDADAKLARSQRGTIAIVYPDFGDKGSPYLDSGVRTFLRGFYDRIPHLLYYLADIPDAASITGCVAAHSRDADVISLKDGSIALPINHLYILVTLIFLFHKAALFARRVGDDPGKLRGHLRGLHPAVRDMLTTVLLDGGDSDQTVGETLSVLPPGFVIYPEGEEPEPSEWDT